MCLLHFNELPFHHHFAEVDGSTLGPDRLEGPIGSTLGEDIWREPVVHFKAVPGKMPIIPDDILSDLSRDQKLAYRWGHAIQSGNVPDDLVSQVIGPLIHVRWLTRSVRSLAKYARTKRPTKKFTRIVSFILNQYLPGWFRIKSRPHIQDGARNFQYLLDLSHDLCQEDQIIVHCVMQDNSHWAHPENVILSCIGDEREEVRQKAVLYIMAAR